MYITFFLILGGFMNKNQRIALAEKELNVKQLGQTLNKHPGYVGNVLSEIYPSPQLRKKISKVLGKPESYLWPEELSA